jgi:hypothetical protein
MKFRSFLLLFLGCFQMLLAQEGFQFENNRNKISLPFKFINNLIIIPIEVNGVSLNFLLDTGVEDSILFSLDETDEVNFAKVEKIRIKGFGSKEAFDAYKSSNNKLAVKNYVDFNHTLYLVLDQDINISAQVGIPVNGIIGYHFFENNVVKINYSAKRITVYKNETKELQKIAKSYEKIPMELISGKPYLTSNSFFENQEQPLATKLLIDTGNTDALWYFKQNNKEITIPNINFIDFLGRGFSGEVYGKRGRINAFQIGAFKLQKPIAAFPDTTATTEIDEIEGRLGSVGSEIMRRFMVVFHYKSNSLYLKRNNDFNDKFSFNMSGLEIQHQGLQWVKESYEDNPVISNNLFDSNGNKIDNNLKYKFNLKPIYFISNVRKDSPAALAGLEKNDMIVKIDRRPAYYYSLQEINDLLKSEDGKVIEFEIDRKGKTMVFRFELKSIL